MSYVDEAKREILFKVVYHGPGLAGKTTNIQWMHEKLPERSQGKLLSVATETDRVLTHDFAPPSPVTIDGCDCRIRLVTVPGPVFYDASRQRVLARADGVVFVADSQLARMDANVESFLGLESNLAANSIEPESIPLVFQYNKRDLPTAVPIATLDEAVNPGGLPRIEAVAYKGKGVRDTFEAIWRAVLARARKAG